MMLVDITRLYCYRFSKYQKQMQKDLLNNEAFTKETAIYLISEHNASKAWCKTIVTCYIK